MSRIAVQVKASWFNSGQDFDWCVDCIKRSTSSGVWTVSSGVMDVSKGDMGMLNFGAGLRSVSENKFNSGGRLATHIDEYGR